MMRLFGALRPRRASAETRTPESDSRMTCRYPAVGNVARLGWWVGADFHEVSAWLEDVSQGGALIVAEAAPATTEVYIRLVQPTETEWTQVNVLRVAARSDGAYRVGARFAEGCPYDLFKSTRGCLMEARDSAASPEFDGRYWK